MALPTNIITTPSQSDVGDLPRTIAVSGTDLFERPSYTDRELFTQSAPDVLVAEWKGGATQGTGIIGDSFVGNGTNAYVDLTSKLPTPTDFIGVSFFMKQPNLASSVNRLVLLSSYDLSPYSNDRTLDIYQNTNGTITAISQSGGNKNTTSINVLTLGEWFSVFIYLDISIPTNPIEMFINGVNNSSYNTNDSISSFPIGIQFLVGCEKFDTQSPQLFSDAEVCNLYWSTNSDFTNHNLKYANLPTIEVV